MVLKDEVQMGKELQVVKQMFNSKGIEFNLGYLLDFYNESGDFDYLMGILLTDIETASYTEKKALMNLFTVCYYQYAVMLKDFRRDIIENEENDMSLKGLMERNTESEIWKKINEQDRVNLLFVAIALPEEDVALEVGILLLIKQLAREGVEDGSEEE